MKRGRTMCRPMSSAGLTLVEMMVALLISIVLMAGVVSIFTSSKQSSKLTNSLGFMQESGRIAVNLITTDLRRAGYFGGNKDVDEMSDGSVAPIAPAATTYNTCNAADDTWARMFKQRVFGLNDTNGTYACIPTGGATAYLRGDVLAVRYAEPQDTAVADISADRLYIRSSLALSKIFYGANEGTNPVVNLQHPIVTYPVTANAYYVGTSAETCNGASIPALFQITLGANGAPQAREIIAGVEDLQVQYGWDSDGDSESIANRYVNASTLNTAGTFNYWSYEGLPAANTVVSARVWIMARAACEDPTYTNETTYTYADKTSKPTDHYRRQLYSATVAFRN